MLLSISHCSQIPVACYRDDNTVTYFGQHVTSLHFDDIILVVHMSRSTWPACIMHCVDTVDRCGYGSLEKALFVILVERITHFEAH